jgi:hypothetical protein
MRCALLLLSSTLWVVGAARADTVFDGVWEGTLAVVGTHGSGQQQWLPEGADSTEVRLDLRDDRARVSLGGRRITLPQDFQVGVHDAAALVYNADVYNGYVGTWQFSLTKLDPDTVLVFAWRVRNFAEPDAASRTIAHALRGELKREPSRRRRN